MASTRRILFERLRQNHSAVGRAVKMVYNDLKLILKDSKKNSMQAHHGFLKCD
jgi:hypothetical protein